LRRAAFRTSSQSAIAPRGFSHKLYCFVEIERFWQVFERAASIGRDRTVQIGVGGHYDDRQVGMPAGQAIE
jgi:hypothetical protein